MYKRQLEEYPGENGPDAQGLAIDYEKLYNAEIEDGILKKYGSAHARYTVNGRLVYAYYAVIPSGVRVIAQRLFDREYLKYVEFPVGLREIGDAAFRDCELREVILPDGVLSIEGHAFQHNRLKKIRLPLSIVNVGEMCIRDRFNIPEQSLKIRTVTIITAESFIFVFGKLIIFGQPQLIDGIIAALLELNADTVALIGNTGFSCIYSYLPCVLIKGNFCSFFHIIISF